MTQAIAPVRQSIFFASDGFGITPKIHAKSNGNKVYEGVAVFRSGTFRDSMGYQNTWEDLHIRQMIDNFDYLKNKSIIQSVPARDGHQGFIVGGMQGKGNVVGWHENIVSKALKSPVDGLEYTYILADYEITEPYAQEKINNGTWRSRSAEIGQYMTNAESEFWPVYMGFAFVDFPAVEGLNFSSSQGNRCFVYFSNRENNVTPTAQNDQQAVSLLLPFEVSGAAQLVPSPPAQQPTAQPPTVQQPAAPFVFSVNGQNVTDMNVVQGYINRLEGFVRETQEASRRSYVANLVSGNKLGAPQQEGMTAFALSLSDEQFALWCKNWDSATAIPLLGNHGGGVSNPDNTAQTGTTPDPLATEKEIVAMHRRNNMPITTLKATASYGKLVAAGIEQA